MKTSLDSHPPIRLGRFWIKVSWLILLLFIVGTLISRSLVVFSKYLSVLISINFFWILCTVPGIKGQKKNILVSVLLLVSIGLSLYWLVWGLGYLRGEVLGVLLVGQIWPLILWITGWRRGFLTDQETLCWWFFNGLLWWFIVSFAFRNIGNIGMADLSIAQSQAQGIIFLAFSLTLPLTVFYIFFKMVRFMDGSTDETILYRFQVLGIATATSLGVLAVMGIPSLFSLSDYWKGWQQMSNSLSLSYNPGRLSSFHFVLDLGNILAQGFFILLGWVLSKYFFTNTLKINNKELRWLWIALCFILLVMFITTWTKLLIPLVFGLLVLFLAIVLRKYYRYGITFLVGLGIIFGILLITDSPIKNFFQDSLKVTQIIQEKLKKDESLSVEDLLATDLEYSASFVYRFQHYLWGWRILQENPLTGVGPYAYTDYVLGNYLEEIVFLPDIFLVPTQNLSLEEKKEWIAQQYQVNRSLLGTHSDWVMIVSSGGIPGMIFYYGLFTVLGYFFWNCYSRSRNLFFLGIVFALLSMMASGITEPNFKDIHFHLLTLYGLGFMSLNFLFFDKIGKGNPHS